MSGEERCIGHLPMGGGTKNGSILSKQGEAIQFDLKVQLYKLRVAQLLFDETLSMVSKPNGDDDTKSETIQCWVVGGKHIYREALRHINASEVNWTHVYMSVDLRGENEVAYFPISCLKEHDFRDITWQDN